MKKSKKLLTLVLAGAMMLTSANAVLAADESFGAAGAAADPSYTLQEMLEYAIQDEYMAQAEYQAIMAKYGTIRPFSNIIKSEATHINLLLPFFKTYGLEVPVNDAADRTVLPATLAATYPIGVEAEVKNIDMYEKFLAQDLPADVELVFERLMAASENHLKAFENAQARAGGNTKSFGGRQARGWSTR